MKESEKGTPGSGSEMSGFRGTNYWARQVGREELPVLRPTVMAIARVFTQAGTSSSAMAEAVSKDPFLSARILRMANSAYYNPGLKKVTAIPRAVVVVGFDAVRQVCHSARFIEETYSGARLQAILRRVVGAYKQALLAQWLGETLRDGSPEELFTAGLLLDIGLLGLLCVVPTEAVTAFTEKSSRCPVLEQALVEKEVFGFEARRLSVRLADEWSLGDLVKRAAQDREDVEIRVHCVRLGATLTAAFEEGRDAAALSAALETAVDRLKIPEASVLRLLHAAENKAREFSSELPLLEGKLPEPKGPATPLAHMAPGLAQSNVIQAPEFLVLEELPRAPADAERQLELLDDMITYLVDSSRAHTQGLLDRAAQGLLEGVGLDRVIYFRVTPDERFLEVKSLYGPFDGRLQGLLVPVDSYPNIFAHVLRGPPWLWVHEKSPASVKSLVTPEVLQFFSSREFLVGRVGMPAHPAGVLAGERLAKNWPIDEKAFLAFRRFCDLTTLGFALLRRT
ncbi:MAG: HDOD domain-containing protein [Desulfosoma sp.]